MAMVNNLFAAFLSDDSDADPVTAEETIKKLSQDAMGRAKRGRPEVSVDERGVDDIPDPKIRVDPPRSKKRRWKSNASASSAKPPDADGGTEGAVVTDDTNRKAETTIEKGAEDGPAPVISNRERRRQSRKETTIEKGTEGAVVTDDTNRKAETTIEKGAEDGPAALGQGTASASSQAALPGKAQGGVTYEILREALPGAKKAVTGDVVRMIYEGRLVRLPPKKNIRFDAGEVDFVLGDGDMVPGFIAGIQGMHVGERRLIRIPSKLGYGKKGKKPKVPPNSDLEFTVYMSHAGLDWGFASSKMQMSNARREKMRRRGRKSTSKNPGS